MSYDTWLQKHYIEAYEKSNAIEQIIEEVLSEKDFDPTDRNNFLIAINDAVLDNIPEKRLQDVLDDPDVGFAVLGRMIYEAVYDYYYKQAENEAAHRYNSRLG